MITKIPRITKKFITDLEKKAKKGSYTVKAEGVDITVFPYVFPPSSPFSESSRAVYDEFGDLKRKTVLDIGTGTGIQAIKAVLAGAKHVDAVDIYKHAVECAEYNVRLNGASDKIRVFESDLFSNTPRNKYDLIIANLPIVDCSEEDVKLHSLFDPGFQYHKRLFEEASEYLAEEGRIVLCHADLQGKEGFDKLERLAEVNGFSCKIDNSTSSLGHEWRRYSFRRKK